MNLGLDRGNLEICGGKRIGKKKGILDFLQRRSERENKQIEREREGQNRKEAFQALIL